jgi:ribosomal protein S27AE
LIGVSIGGPYIGILVVVIVVVAVVAVRLYLMRTPGAMRAKCPKCGNVFDASRSLSGFHIGPLKQLKCPACGKTSLMKTFVTDPITWPPKEKQKEQQTEQQLTSEELEKKRIEESKYEKP